MVLYFLRHGQTDWNKTERIQGRSDVPLNDTGRMQARQAARVLKSCRFDAVFTSPAIRAIETEQLAYGAPSPRCDVRLAEWNFGILEGTKVDWDQFNALFRRNADPVEGAERLEDVIARCASFLTMLETEYADQTVFVVSHGAFFVALKTLYCGDPPNGDFGQYIVKNGVPVRFDKRGKPPVYLTECIE